MKHASGQIDIWKLATWAVSGIREIGREDREDLRQDICLRLLETEKQRGQATHPLAYARRIARNVAIDRLRQLSARRDVVFSDLGIDPLADEYDEKDEPPYVV